jgi:hypothetical protein
MLTFFMIGITIIWCHSFTKLTGTGEKSTTGSLLNTLVCFICFYLLFYLSYILRRRFWMIGQTNSLTTSLIALVCRVGCGCFNVICMDVLYGYECDVVYRYDVMNYIVYGYGVITILCMDMMKYILYECDTYILHECDEVYSVWM